MSDLMRSASAGAPVAGIDLDALIAGEKRRTRRLRWAGGLAVVALVVSAVPMALGFGADEHRSPAAAPAPADCPAASASADCPAVSGPADCPAVPEDPGERPQPQQSHPAPRPTEDCAAAVKRLAGEMSEALAVVPGVRLESVYPTTFAYNSRRLQYEAPMKVTGPNGSSGSLLVRIIAAHEYPDRSMTQCPEKADQNCLYRLSGDDTIVAAVDHGRSDQVEAYRKDGTALLAVLTVDKGSKAPMTLAQLAEAASYPGLTLFP
ncbi:hypothetical protein AB0M02_40275 [Actinoplanes sp. NPDC051861]|uniref:hypothetical protein n=1 Tax=Actinoplanes sp. NPDC051861 TaxID=3155170 RepID=UPI0034477FCB